MISVTITGITGHARPEYPAIAAHLALGLTLAEAVQQARSFVRSALLAGASVKTGQGSGPLNHGFAPVVMRVKPCLERMSLLGAM